MDTFVPIFGRIVNSSLWDEPDFVIKVFLTMLPMKDRDHVVRFSAYNIARMARKTEEEVLEALKILSSPDKRRLEPQEHEGRRIQKVDDGWLILNGSKYQNLMMEIFRRAKNADQMRAARARKHAGTEPSSTLPGAAKPGDPGRNTDTGFTGASITGAAQNQPSGLRQVVEVDTDLAAAAR
jgi:hypothetical protein